MSTDLQAATVELSEISDAIPPRVRTIAYLVTLITGAIATGTTGAVAVLVTNGALAPTTGAVIAGLAGVAASVVATIAGGLGVVYRPRPLDPVS